MTSDNRPPYFLYATMKSLAWRAGLHVHVHVCIPSRAGFMRHETDLNTTEIVTFIALRLSLTVGRTSSIGDARGNTKIELYT